jgi:hypothetical protein
MLVPECYIIDLAVYRGLLSSLGSGSEFKPAAENGMIGNSLNEAPRRRSRPAPGALSVYSRLSSSASKGK